MQDPGQHPQEEERLAALEQLGLLNTPQEERFDDLTKRAMARFGVRMVAVTLIDRKREWYKSCCGDICPPGREGARSVSFCGHALLANYVFVVADTLLDPRFSDNPMVLHAPFIRFYAGVALREHLSNLPVGVFCIKDTKPRQLETQDINDLIDFAKLAEKELQVKEGN
ncbi:MAG: GAF domain-containing protein [Patescibacteria group bacterium]|jgi:GAF domain-containing protein